ncbi:hypothetical protein IFM89_039327 [Coptis chinensis]|uniref:sucrose-phosphate synthase n=1 Tax=Coptis chinensis TaxID=261450 RepID=A0A835HVD3_9MAGN|nr:hypothetical protein IFM89_039327 [Coptis chinensis]
MARNEWINGYLEAILDAGSTKKDAHWISDANSLFSPTKYFVEEVVNRFDETDLHRTWIKVIATRNSRERNNRLENMCWRIWHLARKKKQIAWEDAQRLAKRRIEREEGRKDASEDLSELSEGEKEKGDSNQTEPHKEKMLRHNSVLQMWSDENKSKHLYIVLIRLIYTFGHQVKYVVELARALAKTKGVYRVDLLTRQISSPDVDSSYGEPIEMLSSPSDIDSHAEGDGCGAYIIRLPCGAPNRYIPKESLWPHIPEFVDQALTHIVNMARVIGDQVEGGKPIWPYVIHGHYADAGETLILGNRDDIEDMSNTSSVVLTTVLKLIDKYDLYGQVAYPKHHKQSDVPEIYRLAAKTKGVFINPALVEPFGLTLIEASAYGLPTVATKNGGPVDIHKALSNGLLVDPHDQKAIADALLKLVAEKGLWLECRKNGLKNIHRFSWPEHCRNYLSHIEHCTDSHSRARLEIVPQRVEEPMSDSLKDVEDLSLRFSIDGEFKVNGDLDPVSRQKELIDTLTHHHSITSSGNAGISNYSPGKRQRFFVIAVDCYDANGDVSNDAFSMIIKPILAAASDPAGKTGVLISTGSTLAETMEALRSSQLEPSDFDALICRSGSEMYYPWRDMVADMDYSAHVEYRWPSDHVRSTVARLAGLEGESDGNDIAEYVVACSSHCYTYKVNKPGAKARKTDELRQKLRMRGFRCNLVYSCAATRLNVVPLFASRAQALRYLSVRWGIDLSKMVVFVGEKGDTDYEDLLVGLHKSVILTGSVENGSEALLRSAEIYKREDTVPQDSPNIVLVKEGFGTSDITLALNSILGS